MRPAREGRENVVVRVRDIMGLPRFNEARP